MKTWSKTYLAGGFKPIWKIWKSVGMIIPNTWKKKQMFQPPTRYGTYFPKLRWLVTAGHSDWELTLCRWDLLVVLKKCGNWASNVGVPYFQTNLFWLVVEPTLWKIWVRQLGLLFPIYGKNVPNHQPVILGTDCFGDLFSARWLSNVAAIVCREHIRPVSFCVRRCACHHTRHTRWFPACGGRSWEEKRYQALKTTRMLESKGLVFPIAFCTHRVRFEEPKHGFGWCPGVGKTSCLR